MPDVKPGQVYRVNDWRFARRTLRIETVDDTFARCQTIINSFGVSRARKTRIRLDRFADTTQRGYTLVSGEVDG